MQEPFGAFAPKLAMEIGQEGQRQPEQDSRCFAGYIRCPDATSGASLEQDDAVRSGLCAKRLPTRQLGTASFCFCGFVVRPSREELHPPLYRCITLIGGLLPTADARSWTLKPMRCLGLRSLSYEDLYVP